MQWLFCDIIGSWIKCKRNPRERCAGTMIRMRACSNSHRVFAEVYGVPEKPERKRDDMDSRILVKNADCKTMENGPGADWVYVENGIIKDLGKGEDHIRYENDDVTVIDARRRTVLPGFIDNHFHMVKSAVASDYLDLSEAGNFAEMGALISAHAGDEEAPIIAYRLESGNLKENRYPFRNELDKICDDRPLIIYSTDYHTVMLNTYALLFYKPPFTTAGIEVDEKGMPTGRFGRQAGAKIEERIMDNTDNSFYDEHVKNYLPNLLASGITTIAAVEGGNHVTPIYKDRDCEYILKNMQRFPVTMELFYQTTDVKYVVRKGLKRIGGALYIDGTMGTWTAALSEDYSDRPGEKGHLFYTEEYLHNFVLECCENGIQIGFDAIGDAAIEQVLKILEEVSKDYDVSAMRHRIEHGELIREDQAARAKELGIVLSMQPTYEGLWGQPGGMYSKRLGDRYGKSNPFRMLMDAGVMICGGSDCDVTDLNPLLGIYWAVNHPVEENRLSLEEALRMYTINGAYALFMEDTRGSIGRGKAADIVLLSENLNEIDNAELRDVKVDLTIKDGNVLYRRNTDA